MQYVRDLFSIGKGVLRQAADRAFAPGQWAALPTADIDFRGALARTEGSTGVNDALRFAEKDTADAYRWALVPTLPTDPGADRIAFWDESDNAFRYLTASTGLTLSGTTLSVSTPAAMTLISATPISAAASASVNTCFSATYQSYLVIVSDLSMSAAANLGIRMRVAGVDVSTNTYYSALMQSAASVSTIVSGSAVQSQFFFRSASAATVTDMHVECFVDNPFTADQTTFRSVHSAYFSTPGVFGEYGNGVQTDATSFDGFTLIAGSGTMTGTVRVYGLVNS